jgi:hypothetical protein
MVKPASLKLLSYLPYDYRDDSIRPDNPSARREADRIVHLTFLEKRFHRLQTTGQAYFRQAQTYTRMSHTTGTVGVPVGVLIDIYA